MIAGDYWGNNLNEEYFDPDQYFYLDKLSLLDENNEFFLKDQVHWSPGKRKSKADLVFDFCSRFGCR